MTTYDVELPALDGRDPLGFLAALGLLNLLASECRIPARMAFSATTALARLRSPLKTTEEITTVLISIIDNIPEGGVLPGIPPGFPPASAVGKDPLRQERPQFRTLVDQVRATDTEAAARWLPALVTDLALDNQGRCAITPLNAPSGQQKIRTFFEKPLQAVRRKPSYLHDALTQWQRVEGFTGEYLDHRVLRSRADDVEGRAGTETGVPGATWLAVMATPLLYLTGAEDRTRAALWHRAGRRNLMLWPLWHPPLDIHAAKVLLTHPALIPLDDKPTISSRDWKALGIINAYGAERQRVPGRKSDGVLAPTTVAATRLSPNRGNATPSSSHSPRSYPPPPALELLAA